MILGVLLLFLYIRLFFLYSVSWRKEILPEKENTSDFISVVIACRNEEENISEIIQCIKNQSISKKRIELLYSSKSSLTIKNKNGKVYTEIKLHHLINYNESTDH